MQKSCIIFSFTLAIRRHNIHAYYIYIYIYIICMNIKNIYILIKKKRSIILFIIHIQSNFSVCTYIIASNTHSFVHSFMIKILKFSILIYIYCSRSFNNIYQLIFFFFFFLVFDFCFLVLV
jgi:hypothetical protein